MKYILLELTLKPTRRKILCVNELDYDRVMKSLPRTYSPRSILQPPSKRTLRRWRATGKMKAICGCPVCPGARCEVHNAMSWDTALIGCGEYTYG
jgi:hypothetical protein